MERRETTERRFRAEGTDWRATVAWRASDGSALCYFRPVDGGREESEDRRTRLAPGQELADLDEGNLADLLASASSLTVTERRFRAPDGRDWLAQNIGPVWAEEDAAQGATGILFTALDGELDRGRTGGGHVGRMDGDRLASAWRRAMGQGGGDGDDVDSPGDGDGAGAGRGD